MSFYKQKILIVGGVGFIGSNLCYRLLNDDPNSITIVDNLLSAERENLPHDKRVNFIFGSIVDDEILAKIGDNYDYVFHLATYHGNQSSIYDPLADHQNNSLPTLKLCEHFKGSPDIKKLVYSSAGCVVAEKTYHDAIATDEDVRVSLYLDSPYQISKILGEFYGNYYWKKYHIPFVKARFQNVYGPREILGAGKWRGTPATVWRNVIPTFIWKALHCEDLPVENDGIASRDFIYVDDIAEGLIACALRGKAGDVYNLASGIETTIKHLSETINKITGNPTPVKYLPARSWDQSGKRFGSAEKAKQELGFSAKVSLIKGLQKTIEWTKNNQQLISSNILKHLSFIPEVKKYQ